MDPLTLFALANTAVAAVKKGCQLYKDIKSAAGDVKGVLKDLDDQFHKKYDGKPPPPAAPDGMPSAGMKRWWGETSWANAQDGNRLRRIRRIIARSISPGKRRLAIA